MAQRGAVPPHVLALVARDVQRLKPEVIHNQNPIPAIKSCGRLCISLATQVAGGQWFELRAGGGLQEEL